MKLTVLTNDCVNKRGFIAEHGLSLFIERDGKNILFDTGQSDIFAKNAKTAGVDISKTHAVVISHGHYDHCGGVKFLHEHGVTSEVYLQKGALETRLALNPDGESCREIGCPELTEDLPVRKSFVEIEGARILFPGVTLIGGFGREAGSKKQTQNNFYISKNDSLEKDLFTDEQILVLEENLGLVIILGCSHPGVENCVSQALKHHPGKNVYAVIGGMHLSEEPEKNIKSAADFLKKTGASVVCPLHCTGTNAVCILKKAFKSKRKGKPEDIIRTLGAGEEIIL